jgi:hypothetical protein
MMKLGIGKEGFSGNNNNDSRSAGRQGRGAEGWEEGSLSLQKNLVGDDSG